MCGSHHAPAPVLLRHSRSTRLNSFHHPSSLSRTPLLTATHAEHRAGIVPRLLTSLGLALAVTIPVSPAVSQTPNDANSGDLEEVIVTATLLKETSAPVSASVLTDKLQRQRGAAHLQDVITLAPNVSSSAGASRNRFFQIRGIGERSQFVEPINPSVGILLDGIDLSGAGGALTLYDLNQVEVLRG